MSLDFHVPSGRIHAQSFGSPTAPKVALCIHGLSANMRSFDFLGECLGGDTLQLIAVDLRGRGKSSETGPGTYGWDAHARDILAIADHLNAPELTLVGHSMGGAVAMAAAALDTSHRI